MNLRVLCILMISSAAWAETGAELFQKAVVEERASGNLEEAIKIYLRVAREFPNDRTLDAKALLQAARCYEKLGQDKAIGLYQQVARQFGDQREQAAMARQRLDAIIGAAAPKTGGESAHRITVPTSASLVQSDGRHVFYVDHTGLVVANMDGSNSRVIFPLTAGSSIPSGPRISPDGKLAAFRLATPDHGSYCVVGVDGSDFRELYRVPRAPQPIGGWSPDGSSFIANPVEQDGSYTVATISVKGGSLHKFQTDPSTRGAFLRAAEFTPDGKYIIFGIRPPIGLHETIWIIAVDGSYQGKLIEHPSLNMPVGFAPDGKHFLFQSDRSGQPGIYAIPVADAKAQGEPVLIKKMAGVSATGASLSRNGTFFYTVGEGDHGSAEAFRLGLDGTTGHTVGSPELLSGPAGFIPESAAWSGDGRRLAFTSGKFHEHGGGEVILTVRDLASGKDTEWKTSPETTALLGWAADGTGVYTGLRLGPTGADGELRLVSASTGESKTVARFPGRRLYSVRSEPDKDALLISTGGAPPAAVRFARVIRLDLHTGEKKELIAEGAVSEITFSPDGSQVAAIDRGARNASIMIKPLEGGEWKTLATLEGGAYMFLYWAPNGDLLFGKEGKPNSSILRLSSGGGTPQKVADLKSMEHVHEIRVRPDGRQLIFQSVVNNIEFWALENFLPEEFLQP